MSAFKLKIYYSLAIIETSHNFVLFSPFLLYKLSEYVLYFLWFL